MISALTVNFPSPPVPARRGGDIAINLNLTATGHSTVVASHWPRFELEAVTENRWRLFAGWVTARFTPPLNSEIADDQIGCDANKHRHRQRKYGAPHKKWVRLPSFSAAPLATATGDLTVKHKAKRRHSMACLQYKDGRLCTRSPRPRVRR